MATVPGAHGAGAGEPRARIVVGRQGGAVGQVGASLTRATSPRGSQSDAEKQALRPTWGVSLDGDPAQPAVGGAPDAEIHDSCRILSRFSIDRSNECL
jgi:hypothetical protein